MARQAAWTPLSEASLFAHYDMSQYVLDGSVVSQWTDQGPHAKHAIRAYGSDSWRPPIIADAGDGKTAIDFRVGTYGKALASPWTAEELRWLHDGSSSWTVAFNLNLIAPDASAYYPIVSSGGYAGSGNAGIVVFAFPSSYSWVLRVSYTDGATIVHLFNTLVSSPENAHYLATFDPAASPKAVLYRNGSEVADWNGSVPSAALLGLSNGLVLGKFSATTEYVDGNWYGRFLTIYAESIRDLSVIGNHVEWAHAQEYV